MISTRDESLASIPFGVGVMSTVNLDESTTHLTVLVVLAMPRVQYRCNLKIPPGTTARQAVLMALDAGLVPVTAAIDFSPASAPLGVYNERVEDHYPCAQGDRVEIYRPLHQDPKELRRQRARQSSS